jgi:hypothetical protein
MELGDERGVRWTAGASGWRSSRDSADVGRPEEPSGGYGDARAVGMGWPADSDRVCPSTVRAVRKEKRTHRQP